jgi:hypothetical protein
LESGEGSERDSEGGDGGGSDMVMMNGLIGYARGLVVCVILSTSLWIWTFVYACPFLRDYLVDSWMNGMEIEEVVDDGVKIRSVDDVLSDFL